MGETLARASSLVESLLGDLFSNHTSVRLMEHAARARPLPVRRPGLLRPARPRAAADDGAHRPARAAALDGAGLSDAHLARARRSSSTVPWLLLLLALAVVPGFLGETHYAVARILAPLPLDARAAQARLPALSRRERPAREGGADVRSRAVARRALPRSLREVLRGEQTALRATGHRRHRALGRRDCSATTALMPSSSCARSAGPSRSAR